MRFCLGGRDISNRFEQSTIVEPVDPLEGSEFDRFGTSPWATPVDHLGLEQTVDRFGERIVVAVSDAANRRFVPFSGERPRDIVLLRYVTLYNRGDQACAAATRPRPNRFFVGRPGASRLFGGRPRAGS